MVDSYRVRWIVSLVGLRSYDPGYDYAVALAKRGFSVADIRRALQIITTASHD